MHRGRARQTRPPLSQWRRRGMRSSQARPMGMKAGGGSRSRRQPVSCRRRSSDDDSTRHRAGGGGSGRAQGRPRRVTVIYLPRVEARSMSIITLSAPHVIGAPRMPLSQRRAGRSAAHQRDEAGEHEHAEHTSRRELQAVPAPGPVNTSSASTPNSERAPASPALRRNARTASARPHSPGTMMSRRAPSSGGFAPSRRRRP